jgi:hypothetical protein
MSDYRYAGWSATLSSSHRSQVASRKGTSFSLPQHPSRSLLIHFANNSKPLPPPKKETTWSRFAAKKGIKPKTAEERKKLVYDEAIGEWVPKWGYKGKNKEGEGDWIVEVDDKKRNEGEEQRGDGRRERKEKVRRNERLQRKNEKGFRKGK